MSHYCYLNGCLLPRDQAHIAMDDRGWLLADGLFETLRVVGGEPEYLTQHWQRLALGAARLQIPLLWQAVDLSLIIRQLLQINQLQDAVVRVTLSRGSGPRGLAPPEHPQPTGLVTVSPLALSPSKPLRLMWSDYPYNERSPMAGLKTLAYTEKIMIKQAALAAGYDDAVLCNTQGSLCSTTAANIFMWKDSVLYTPALSGGALPGITRQVVIERARQQGRQVVETCLWPAELLAADAVFITNSLIGCRQVQSLETTEFRLTDEDPL